MFPDYVKKTMEEICFNPPVEMIKFIREITGQSTGLKDTHDFCKWFNKNCPEAMESWKKMRLLAILAKQFADGELHVMTIDEAYVGRKLTVEQVRLEYGLYIVSDADVKITAKKIPYVFPDPKAFF